MTRPGKLNIKLENNYVAFKANELIWERIWHPAGVSQVPVWGFVQQGRLADADRLNSLRLAGPAVNEPKQRKWSGCVSVGARFTDGTALKGPDKTHLCRINRHTLQLQCMQLCVTKTPGCNYYLEVHDTNIVSQLLCFWRGWLLFSLYH